MRPANDAEMGQPTVSVASAKPAINGVAPSTTCTNVGTYEVRPNSTAPTANETALPPSTTLRWKTHSGRTGSAALRSTNTKTTSEIRPTTKIEMLTGESQAQASPPSSSPRISSEQPTVSSVAPR